MASASSALKELSERDWANLTSGPAGLIAERVLSDDVADYVRFRGACTAWRACCADPRAHGVFDRRFHPRRRITLPGGFDAYRLRIFLNVLTGERIHVPLPDLARCSCFVLGRTAEGLLVLCRTDTYAVQLLNPLTRQIADLPSASTLFGSDARMWRRNSKLREGGMDGAGIAGDSMVVLQFRYSSLAIAEPGDERWTTLRVNSWIKSSLPFAGRFYCATYDGISVLDTSVKQRPKLVVAAGYHPESSSSGPVCLLDIDGELAYCAWTEGPPYTYKACWVQLETRDTVPAPVLGLKGHALFVCSTRSLVVSAKLSLAISTDTIYACLGSYIKNRCLRLEEIDLLGRLTESMHSDKMVQYLSFFVLMSQDVMHYLPEI